MKRTKRKYTRKVSPDNVQLVSDRLKGSDKGIIPPHIEEAIESILEYRKRMGLFDDSEERWERAKRYWLNH